MRMPSPSSSVIKSLQSKPIYDCFFLIAAEWTLFRLRWQCESNGRNEYCRRHCVSGDGHFGPLSLLIPSIDKTQFNPFVQNVDRKIAFLSFYSPVDCRFWIWHIGCSFMCVSCVYVWCGVEWLQKSFNRPIIKWIFIHTAFSVFFVSFSFMLEGQPNIIQFWKLYSKHTLTQHEHIGIMLWLLLQCEQRPTRSLKNHRFTGRKMKMERFLAIDRSQTRLNGRTERTRKRRTPEKKIW